MASQEYRVTESMAKSKSDYFMESEEEISRLSNQHEVIKDAMGGQLVHAPLDLSGKPLRIVDSGTADGTWVIDIDRATGRKHEIIGTDILEKDFPKNPPANIRYHAQDINKEWPAEYKESFDLVHQRLVMVGSGPDWEAALQRLAGIVKPGGWIQLMEAENKTPTSEAENPAMHDFVRLMTGIFKIMGAPLTLAEDIPSWLNDNGFENVQQKTINGKFGNNNLNPDLAKRGIYSNVVAANGLVQFAKTLPEPPLPKEKLETFVPELRKELSEKGAVFPLRLIWAQKKSAM